MVVVFFCLLCALLVFVVCVFTTCRVDCIVGVCLLLFVCLRVQCVLNMFVDLFCCFVFLVPPVDRIAVLVGFCVFRVLLFLRLCEFLCCCCCVSSCV